MSAAPLDGVRVVEIGVAMAGPFCAMLLADYGAQVVKIERVGVGDDSRAWPPYFHDALGHYFASANRNKQSVALDLKRAEGVEVVRRLIGGADVVVDNYRVGALERAGAHARPPLSPRSSATTSAGSMHADTDMSYHGADPPGAPIFDGCIGRRPGRETATLGMSSRELPRLRRRESYEVPGRRPTGDPMKRGYADTPEGQIHYTSGWRRRSGSEPDRLRRLDTPERRQ